jgi:hypothetical protein
VEIADWESVIAYTSINPLKNPAKRYLLSGDKYKKDISESVFIEFIEVYEGPT